MITDMMLFILGGFGSVRNLVIKKTSARRGRDDNLTSLKPPDKGEIPILGVE
jgi:hypothetical protein